MKTLVAAAVATRNWIGEPDRSIRNVRRWAERAADSGAELIVFPELGINGYIQHNVVWDIAEPIPGPSTDKLIAVAAELGVILSCGLLERDSDITYNTQVIVSGDGLLGKQRKIHMPGAEALYWRGGHSIEVIDIGKARAGIAICYDAGFAEMQRTLFCKGAEILIMPFAYATAGPRATLPERGVTIMGDRVACVSNGCFGLICNNAGKRPPSRWERKGHQFTGWAGVIGPNGEIEDFTRSRGHGEAMALATLDAAKLAEKRRSEFFIPRALRPEMYETIDSPHDEGSARE